MLISATALLQANPRPTEDGLGLLYSGQGNPYHSESFEPLTGGRPFAV